MTLTEFLLARIVEDEEWVPRVLDEYGDGDFGGSIEFGPADARRTVAYGPARFKAECEAKRRIVESTRFSDDPRSVVDFWLDPERRDLNPGLQVESLTIVLKHLAAVYADHPDYREEWRP